VLWSALRLSPDLPDFDGRVDGWSVNAEYLYFNLGSRGITTSALALAANNAAGTVLTPFVTTAITSTTSDFKGNVVRVGLNYKFGSWLAVR
jgi:opacity protein-like surface antigen